MAGGITYADLRFARSPPEKSQGEEPNEGELTYENLQVPRALEQEVAECGPPKNTPELPCWANFCHRWRPVANRPMLGALALCLFLLATNIALGVQYLQASGKLQQATRDHAAKSHVLGERTHHLQAGLEESRQLLRLTEQELNSTTVALWQSQAAENQTRQQLQHQVDQANRSLALLQTNLSQATSCRQIGCCPHGWTLFRWKCLRASSEKKTWRQSKFDCEKRSKGESSQLLVLKLWSAQELWEAVGDAFPKTLNSWESNCFWIGLLKDKDTGWKWVDGSRYEAREQLPNVYYGYAFMDNGQLLTRSSSWTCGFICEKAASPEEPPAERWAAEGLLRDSVSLSGP